MQRWLSKYAVATLVHNDSLLSLVDDWPGRVLVLDDPPAFNSPSSVGRTTCAAAFMILVISSYSWDEPVGIVFEAARQLPEITFHITGDPRRLDKRSATTKPGNVVLTGFLPRDDYFRELKDANTVMVLTTRDNTMLRGAWEALYAGQPLILSDQHTLRSYLERGVIFVPNTTEGIVDGIRRARDQEINLRQEMTTLACVKRERWQIQAAQIAKLLDISMAEPELVAGRNTRD